MSKMALEMAQAVQKSLHYLQACKQVPAQQLRLESQLSDELARVLSRAGTETIRELQRVGVVPQGSAQARTVLQHLEGRVAEMQGIVANRVVPAFDYGRNRALNATGNRITAFSPRIVESLRGRVFEASARTLNRMVGDVMLTLEAAADSGLSIAQTAELLETDFARMQDFEVNRIARTEVNRAQQEAVFETERELGVQYHQWLTAEDERVRDSHIDQHNEIVRLGEPFSNGLTRPGDPAGPVEEIINCRCRLAPFLPPHGSRPPADKDTFFESDFVSEAS